MGQPSLWQLGINMKGLKTPDDDKKQDPAGQAAGLPGATPCGPTGSDSVRVMAGPLSLLAEIM
jgi:hypothetical protein